MQAYYRPVAKPNRITIRTIRELKGLSQRELARRIDASSGYVTRVENGKTVPSRAMCERMAQAMEVKLEVLIGDPS